MHGEQNLVEPVDDCCGQIASDGDKVAWEFLGLRQNGDFRLSLVVKPGVIVVTKRSRRRLVCENQFDRALRARKDIADLLRGNNRVDLALLRKLESISLEEELRKEMA